MEMEMDSELELQFDLKLELPGWRAGKTAQNKKTLMRRVYFMENTKEKC